MNGSLKIYERDFMDSLNHDNQADVIEALNSRYLDYLLKIDNPYFEGMVKHGDDFDFDIVNFPVLDDDVPRRASHGVYISKLIRFARVCNHVADFNARNKC